MKTIIVATLLAYLLGAAWMYVFTIEHRDSAAIKAGIMECIGWGQLILIAAFFVLSFVPLQRGMQLQSLAKYTLYACVALGVVALVVLRHHVMDPIRHTWKRMGECVKESAAVYLVGLVLGIIAWFGTAFCFQPDITDTTPEYVMYMLQTGELALADPYRMTLLEPLAVNHSPLYVIYAIGAFWDGLNGVIYVQRFLPLVLVPGILGLYRWIASVCFESVKQQNRFFLIVIVLGLLEVVRTHALLTGVFQNPWAGQTMLAMVVIPTAFAVGICLARRMQWKLIPYWLLLLLAGQCVYAKGFAPVGLLGVVAGIIAFMERRRNNA